MPERNSNQEPAKGSTEQPVPVKVPAGTKVVPARIKVPASKPVPSQASRYVSLFFFYSVQTCEKKKGRFEFRSS